MKKDMKNEAKRESLKALKKMMMEDMGAPVGEKLKGMQKVTVAAPDAEGLEEGLSMAEKILKKRLGDSEEMSEENEEMPEELMKMMEMEEDEDEYACGGMKKYRK